MLQYAKMTDKLKHIQCRFIDTKPQQNRCSVKKLGVKILRKLHDLIPRTKNDVNAKHVSSIGGF